MFLVTNLVLSARIHFNLFWNVWGRQVCSKSREFGCVPWISGEWGEVRHVEPFLCDGDERMMIMIHYYSTPWRKLIFLLWMSKVTSSFVRTWLWGKCALSHCGLHCLPVICQRNCAYSFLSVFNKRIMGFALRYKCWREFHCFIVL